ncbi:MAG: hypothetical protein FJY66_05930 [Calditrichaeota bacterium]|nr:hypothetical protein [Calditrichota bacterium]
MLDSSLLRFAEQYGRSVRLALEAARCGGEVLLRFWRAGALNRVEEKAKGDLVTQADLESEKAVSDFL